MKPGRNDPCSCGSGKKFKHCCEGKAVPRTRMPLPAEINPLIALYNTGRHAELENRARLLVGQYPDFGFGWKLLGGALQMQGKDALHAFQKTAELMPDDAGAHYNLGVALKSFGLLADAAASYRRVVELKPDFAMAHYNLGNTLKDLGQLAAAVASYRRALQLKPDYADAHSNLGITLKELGQPDGAVASYRKVVELKPDFAEAHYNLGNVLSSLAKFDDAVASYRRALEIEPDFADAHVNLGNALKDLGKLDDAVASYRRALEIKPDLAVAHSNLLFCLNHSQTVDAQTLFAEHRRFADRFEAPLRANWPQHSNSRNPDRCLQVGFVSGDLRKHPVAQYLEPALVYLARYPQLSLHAYYNHTIEDSVTQRLRGYMTHWHSIAGLSDSALAQKIREDGIDILYDLSGHTAKHRLLTFTRKPAPVQVSWIGYPGTTGLSAMDYYQSDRYLFPDGRFYDQFTEKIVRLPASSAFLQSNDAPPVNALPALSNGYMTFGSFNRLEKISRSVVALWAQLLRALPDSRMLIGAMPEGKYQTLTEWFAQEGIARDRLSFHARTDMEHYLGLHHQVDICLDTFPYSASTTSFHALWMGVPTLTLAGETLAGWAGASILGHVGLDAFVSHDADDFVQKGLSWAGNLKALSDIRTGLRERFMKSARGRPEVVAASMERAMRIMWERWCAGLPAESFEVPWQDIESTVQQAEK